jgi:drug/metabolite transporter (DMT)-like permease
MVDAELLDKSNRYAWGAALFAVIAWGASFIATKIVLRELNPASVIWLRSLLGTMVLGGILVHRRQPIRINRNQLLYLGLLGFLGVTLHQWLQSFGLITAQAATTAWIIAIIPVFIALLGWIFLKERLLGLQIFGIIVAVLGVLLVVSGGDLFANFRGSFGVIGDYFILISALNWAIFSVLSRRTLLENPAAVMMFYVMTWGWLFATVFLFRSQEIRLISRMSLQGWLAIGFLGIVCSGLAYVAWYYALKKHTASQVGVFLYLEPLVTLGLAAVLLEEAITIASIAGGISILFGVWLVNRVDT